jgi:hypothetical protein
VLLHIETRWKVIQAAETASSWVGHIAGWAGGFATEGGAADFAVGEMNSALKAWNL